MATKSPAKDSMKAPSGAGWFSGLIPRGGGAPSDTHARQGEADAAADGRRNSADSDESAEFHDANQTLPTVRLHIPRPGSPRPNPPDRPSPGFLAVRPSISPSPIPSCLFSLFPSRRADVGVSPVTLQNRLTSSISLTRDEAERYYAPTTCFGTLGRENPLRRACISIAESKWFETFILLAILSNAVVLCQMEPSKMEGRGCSGTPAALTYGAGNSAIEDSELFFTVVFTIEMLVKMIASGVYFEQEAYLKDGWNVMDFVVVVVSLVSLIPGMGSNVSALRVIRVLRPLRTLSVLPGMRTLIGTMIRSVPMIGNVLLFCIFFFIIFGIFGLQVFRGALRNRCFTVVTGTTCADHESHADAVMCRDVMPDFGADRNLTAAVLLADDDERTCATHVAAHWPGYSCPTGMMCLKANNPAYGLIHFDNIAHAWLTIFQCITLEGWTPIMYMTMDAVTGWTVVYFLLLVFTGGFFLLNLALAVITEVYDEECTEAQMEADEREEAEDKDEEHRRLMAERKAKREALSHHLKNEGMLDDDSDDEGDRSEDGKVGSSARPRGGIAAIRAVVEHRWFGPFFTVLILINTLVLAMEFEGMSDAYAAVLSGFNLALTISFMVEMVLKIAGLGPREYVGDSFNIFDAVVVLISIIELAMANSGSLSALRSFRILRVLKLVRSWTTLQRFLYTVYVTVRSLGEFAFIVVLAIFIFALLGMQLFGGKMCGLDDGETPRHNFDTLLWALVTVFQVLTGEDWNAVMYDGVAANGSWSALYFVLLLVIGNFLVLNLFVAILLTNFGAQEVSTELQSTKKLLESISFFRTYLSKERGQREKTPEQLAEQKFWAELPDKVIRPRVMKRWERLGAAAQRRTQEEDARAQAELDAKLAQEEEDRMARLERERRIAEGRGGKRNSGALMCFGGYDLSSLGKAQPGGAPKPLHRYRSNSLKLFSPTNPLRRFCYAVVDDKRFDLFIMLCIAVSSLTMIFESPKAMEKESFASALDAVDIIFTVLFAMEMVVKLVAYGMWLEESNGTYLRDAWNCLDGFIVVMGIVGKILAGQNLGWVRALRTMRVLRPLRVISRIPELKVVVNALFRSLPGLGNVLLVALLFWLIFGILGMQLFMGAFARCSDEDIDAKVDCVDGQVNATMDLVWDSVSQSCEGDATITSSAACVGTYQLVEFRERRWKSDDMNFDNIFNAMETLFEMSTTEGWTAVMYNGVDSRSPELVPVRDNNPPIAFFFVVFEIVANFFILNLFVGIILDNFAQISQESGDGSSATMTKEQKLWTLRRRNFFGEKEDKVSNLPPHPVRRAAYRFSHDERFEWFIMAVITVNAFAMACEHYQQSEAWTQALDIVSYICAAVFIAEAVIKLVGLGVFGYFAKRWNQFDFFCVATSVIGFAANAGGGASVLRILRLARIFRLVRKLKGLRMLFNTLVISLPGLVNIGSLLFLLCFVYAVLGMQLFGKVKFGENLNEHANFRDFGNSMLILLRMVTGEAWNAIMYDVMVDEDCDDSDDCAIGECCGVPGAPAYFVTFVILGTFVTLNLLIAVVVDNFSNSKKEEMGENVTDENIGQFERAWRRIDRDASGYINREDVAELIKRTPPPLGVKGTRISRLGMVRFMKSLDLVQWAGLNEMVHYEDVLIAATRRAMAIVMETLPEETQVEVRAALKMKSSSSLSRMTSRGDDELLSSDDEGKGVVIGRDGTARKSLKAGLRIVDSN